MDEDKMVQLLEHSIFDAECEIDAARNDLGEREEGESGYYMSCETLGYARGAKDAYESIAAALNLDARVDAEVQARRDAIFAENDYWLNKVDLGRADF